MKSLEWRKYEFPAFSFSFSRLKLCVCVFLKLFGRDESETLFLFSLQCFSSCLAKRACRLFICIIYLSRSYSHLFLTWKQKEYLRCDKCKEKLFEWGFACSSFDHITHSFSVWVPFSRLWRKKLRGWGWNCLKHFFGLHSRLWQCDAADKLQLLNMWHT